MEVKWLISLVVGEPGASGKSSESFGFGSPAGPGIRAEGSVGSLLSAKRGSTSS